jgi:hypothetical protein
MPPQQTGVEPSDLDPITGEPRYGLSDVAKTIGVPAAGPDATISESGE